MQNPLLGYPPFPHFLDLTHQQYPPGRGPGAGSAASSPSPLFMYSALRQQALTTGGTASGNITGDSSSSGSPSPPSSATSSSAVGKSFTIDAILGLGDANKFDCAAKCVATDLSTGAAARGVATPGRHAGVSERATATVAGVLHPLQASYGVGTCRRPSQG